MPYRSILTSFTAGEFSPLLDGRLDLARFKSSAKSLENFIVKPYGGISKIPGSHFVAALKNHNASARLLEFSFNSKQNYILVMEGGREVEGVEVGGYMRIMSGHGYIKNQDNSIYEIETPFRSEDVKNIFYLQHRDVLYVACGTRPVQKVIRHAHDNWTIEAAGSKNGPYGEANKDKEKVVFFPAGSGDMEITANFDLFTPDRLGQYLKINDGDVKIKEIVDVRTAKVSVDSEITPEANTESYGEELYVQPENGDEFVDIEVKYTKKYFFCFEVTSDDGEAVSFDLVIKNTKHTEDEFCSSTFSETGVFYITIDVGDYLGGTLPYDSASNSYPPDPDKTTLRVEFLNRSANSTVDNILFRLIEPDHPKATYCWAWEAFNEEHGYPQVISLENRRLVVARNKKYPNGIWFSKSDGEREDFSSWDTEKDTTGIFVQLESGSLEEICWLQPKDGKLYCGTGLGIWKLSAPDTAKNMAPTNIQATKESTYGSILMDSLLVGDGIVFAERGGERVREYSYNLKTDNWEPSDLTLWGEHILRESPIIGYAWQQQPFGVLWVLREDGVLCSITYLKKENVLAVSRHPKKNCKVEAIATIINDNGKEEIWMVCNRTIKGETRRYVEYLESEYEDQDDWFYVDSGLTYEGDPISKPDGLDHLAGETVKVVANGFVLQDQVVADDGSVKLIGPSGEMAAGRIIVGLGYDAVAQTQPLEQPVPEGAMSGIPLHIAKVFVRLYKTGDGVAIYKDVDQEYTRQDIILRPASTPMDQPTPAFTGIKEAFVVSGYDPDTTIAVKHTEPTACNVVGFILEWEKGES